MSLANLHCFKQHCLFGCTLLDNAFAIFGEIVCLVQEPVTHMRMWVTRINEEFLEVSYSAWDVATFDLRFP
jgi:hypothetical protein